MTAGSGPGLSSPARGGGLAALRGLATLPIRIRTAPASAATLADRLAAHPRVTAPTTPPAAPAAPAGQMDGGGALLAFEVTCADIGPSAISAVYVI